jgi:hypothetical protein
LHYGYVGIDYVANALTLLGIVALFLLFRVKVEAVRRPLWDPIGRVGRRRPKPPVGGPAAEGPAAEGPATSMHGPAPFVYPDEATHDVGSTDRLLE